MSENTAEPGAGATDRDDEIVALNDLQDNDSDTIKHSEDGNLEEREG